MKVLHDAKQPSAPVTHSVKKRRFDGLIVMRVNQPVSFHATLGQLSLVSIEPSCCGESVGEKVKSGQASQCRCTSLQVQQPGISVGVSMDASLLMNSSLYHLHPAIPLFPSRPENIPAAIRLAKLKPPICALYSTATRVAISAQCQHKFYISTATHIVDGQPLRV